MKINVVGCHCTWTKSLSSSYFINDDCVLDVPSGSGKKLINDFDIKKVKYIFITHFHSDHFLDMHMFLEQISFVCPHKVTVIAPKGCKEKLVELFKLLSISYLEKFLEDYVSFIDCENGKKIIVGPYKVKILKMSHGIMDAYGYIFEEGDKKIGFTGDSCMCNSILKMAKNCNYTFIDSSSVVTNSKHLSVDEILKLQQEFSNNIFYPTHMTYQSEKEILKTNLHHITEGQIIEI